MSDGVSADRFHMMEMEVTVVFIRPVCSAVSYFAFDQHGIFFTLPGGLQFRWSHQCCVYVQSWTQSCWECTPVRLLSHHCRPVEQTQPEAEDLSREVINNVICARPHSESAAAASFM